MTQLIVAGCSSGIGHSRHASTAMVINDLVALEAGSGLMNLDLETLLKIRSVVISHAHFDHVCGLPFLVELIKQQSNGTLTVYGPSDAIEALQQNVFNNRIWPDFTMLPSAHQASLKLVALQPDQIHTIEGLSFLPVRVNHTVPAFGYFIQGESGWLAYSGDTGPCPEFVHRLITWPRLHHALVECSFPRSLASLATETGHLYTEDLIDLRVRLPMNTSLWVLSMKAWFLSDIQHELIGSNESDNDSLSGLNLLEQWQILDF
ncbi:MAG TPA: 3',5'-cyclic-nucleotide phosphodiesterase [Limnobacter sp.]|uniref:3',5'-cyclic-nucleotide phosphodiesterase n=1 Tax=Limnobacter sp. TaxID=2003368 RepID=UPI002ED7D04D